MQGTGAARGCDPGEVYGDGVYTTNRYPTPADGVEYDIALINFPTDMTIISSFHSASYAHIRDITHDDTDFFFSNYVPGGSPYTDWYKLSGMLATDTVLASYSWSGASTPDDQRPMTMESAADEYIGTSAAAGLNEGRGWIYDGMTGTAITSQTMSAVSGGGDEPWSTEFTGTDWFWESIIATNKDHWLTSGHITDTVISSITYTVPPDSTNVTSRHATTHDGTDAVIDISGVSGGVGKNEIHLLSGIAATETILASFSWAFVVTPGDWWTWGSYATRYV